MTKYSKKEEPLADEFKPNLRDALSLGRELARFSPRKMNGRTVYAFHQYCAEKNILKLDAWGDPILKNVSEFHRLNQLNDLLEWKKEKDLLADLEQFPEEKAAHEKKLSDLFKGMREMLTGKLMNIPPKEKLSTP